MIRLNGVPLLDEHGHFNPVHLERPQRRSSHYERHPEHLLQLRDTPTPAGSPWGMNLVQEVFDAPAPRGPA